MAFHYDNIKYLSFNLFLFKIIIIVIIIIIIIHSARRESIWGSGGRAQINLNILATISIKSAAGPIE
jgi:hypothetical protein